MNLEEYIKDREIPISKLAKRVGVNVRLLYGIIRRERKMTLDVAVRIEDGTQGAITYKELAEEFHPEDHKNDKSQKTAHSKKNSDKNKKETE